MMALDDLHQNNRPHNDIQASVHFTCGSRQGSCQYRSFEGHSAWNCATYIRVNTCREKPPAWFAGQTQTLRAEVRSDRIRCLGSRCQRYSPRSVTKVVTQFHVWVRSEVLSVSLSCSAFEERICKRSSQKAPQSLTQLQQEPLMDLNPRNTRTGGDIYPRDFSNCLALLSLDRTTRPALLFTVLPRRTSGVGGLCHFG
jgi:hypothetical protein